MVVSLGYSGLVFFAASVSVYLELNPQNEEIPLLVLLIFLPPLFIGIIFLFVLFLRYCKTDLRPFIEQCRFLPVFIIVIVFAGLYLAAGRVLISSIDERYLDVLYHTFHAVKKSTYLLLIYSVFGSWSICSSFCSEQEINRGPVSVMRAKAAKAVKIVFGILLIISSLMLLADFP